MPSKKSSEKTKEKIKDAFITLYENNSIDRISIRQLADTAGVNRATFYSHYLDIYDLLEQIEDEKYEILYSKLSTAVPQAINGENFKAQFPDMKFFKENEKWMKVLIGIYGKSDIIERIKENIKAIICTHLGFQKDSMTPEMEYLLEYLVSANASVFIKWIKNEKNVDIEKLADIVSTSMIQGPITALMKSY